MRRKVIVTICAAMLGLVIVQAQQRSGKSATANGADGRGLRRHSTIGRPLRLRDRQMHEQRLRLRRPLHAGRRLQHRR